jgi:peroxiredoxin
MVVRHRRVLVLAFLATLVAVATAGCSSSQQPDQGSPPRSPSANGDDGTTDSCDPKVGGKAPKLAVKSATGKGTLSIAKGKVTIVDFWATWCKPCEASFPKYQELYVKYKSSGLDIVAISVDEEGEKVPPFTKAHGADFPIGWDDSHKLAKCWRPDPMPTMFIVDKQGIVRHVHRRWENGDEKVIEKQIKALL